MSQEPIPSGNLPPGFDANACRSVYVGNIHPLVTDALLAELFATVGPIESCKLIRKEKSSFGFIDYYDHASAASALVTLNGRPILGQAIKVNWAYVSGQREDTSSHYSIFVGDLSPEITDAILFAAFSIYSSCSDARVMWDQRSGRSRGFGFVSFRNQQEAEAAITEMTGKWLGSRQMRCNWAAKTTFAVQEESKSQAANMMQPSLPETGFIQPSSTETPEQKAQIDAAQLGPQYTTVYVGNLSSEVTQAELHRQFYGLGVGVIEEVRVQKDKGFGFVRYRSHEEAALAIQTANGRVIGGRSVKCSWGSKPTTVVVQGAGQTGLPPPVAYPPYNPAMAMNTPYTTADLMAYQQQIAMAQAALYQNPQIQTTQIGPMQPQMQQPQNPQNGASLMGSNIYDPNAYQQQYGVPGMPYSQQQNVYQ